MLTDGKIGFGTNSPTTDAEFYRGTVKFNVPSTTQDLLITNYQDGQPIIRPTADNYGGLGNVSVFWKYSYIKTGQFDQVKAYTYTTLSDGRLKKNVTPLQNSLENVLRLKPCKYDLDLTNSTNEHMQNTNPDEYKNQLGFVAQELMEVYPELVKLDSATQLLSINYDGLIAVLAAAIQEQNKKIKEQEKKIAEIDTRINPGNSNTKNTAEESIDMPGTATLGKNSPNPFNESTRIDFYLPEETQNAELNIYDLQGKQLNSIEVTSRENGQIIIQGSELQPGMYYYSLIADGRVVGTETMILTD